MRHPKPLLFSAAAAISIVLSAMSVPIAAQAAVPTPVGGSCMIHLSITGSHTIHVQSTTCKWQSDEPQPAYMTISYHFNVTGQSEDVLEKTCTATAGLGPCLKEYTFIGPSPSGSQTYRMSAYASWYAASGRRSTAQASTAVVD